MLEKHLNFYTELNNIYPSSDKGIALRKIALVLASLIPLFLLFSRVIADTALTVTGILFVTYCIKTKYYSYLKQPIVITVIALWLWFMVSSLFAFSDKTQTFLVSFVYVRFFLFFLACSYWLFTEIKAFQFAGKIITLVVVIAASDALFQFFTGFSISGREIYEKGRLTSFLRRPDIGIYLTKLIFPVVALWMCSAINSDNKKNLFLSSFLLFSVIIVIFLTGERAATALALMALILALLIIAIHNKRLRIYTISAIIGVVGMFTYIIYKVPFIYQRVLKFIVDIGNFPNSLYGQLFKASIYSWYEYGILTGVGIRQFRNACIPFKEEGLVTYCDLHSHNIYLEILSESGAIGLGIFTTFVLLCLWNFVIAAIAQRNNLGNFIGCIFAFAGLFTILFPVSVSMSFITNWSGTLNWMGISLCFSMLLLNSQKS